MSSEIFAFSIFFWKIAWKHEILADCSFFFLNQGGGFSFFSFSSIHSHHSLLPLRPNLLQNKRTNTRAKNNYLAEIGAQRIDQNKRAQPRGRLIRLSLPISPLLSLLFTPPSSPTHTHTHPPPSHPVPSVSGKVIKSPLAVTLVPGNSTLICSQFKGGDRRGAAIERD